jgi:hypothetical protein
VVTADHGQDVHRHLHTVSVERAPSTQHDVRDPTDEIIELATAVQSPAISADARRISERLDRARLFVAVTGDVLPQLLGPIDARLDRPVTFRFGRVPRARLTLRNGSVQTVPVGAIAGDVAAIDYFVDAPLLRAGVCIVVGAAPRPSHLTIRSVDDVAAIQTLATESGAARVESYATEQHRQLCIRLGHHLAEQHRALVRPLAVTNCRINALTIARVLAEQMLDARSRRTDEARKDLAQWLATERTKFLMSTKADALLALGDRLARIVKPRHQLRTAVAAASHEIAIDLLAQLWQRTSSAVDTPIAALARSLLADLDLSLGDLGDHLSPQALTGFDAAPIRGMRRDLEWPTPASSVMQLGDRFGLASRQRIVAAARDALVDALSSGSRRVIERVLFDYDEASSAIERRFCELLDAAIQSVRVAADVAQEAQAGGPDLVARTRHRIVKYGVDLESILVRLDEHRVGW